MVAYQEERDAWSYALLAVDKFILNNVFQKKYSNKCFPRSLVVVSISYIS